MTEKQQRAYDWAKNQKFTSVSAQYARILAELVDELQAKINCIYMPVDKVVRIPEEQGEAK